MGYHLFPRVGWMGRGGGGGGGGSEYDPFANLRGVGPG